jgi:CRISPR-associated protein Cas5d
MAYGIRLKIWGEYACFTRPEMKAERVSYDVITPSAARGILEAIHWKPAIRWVIDKIHVLNPIKFDNIRRNEVEKKINISAKEIEDVMQTGGPLHLLVEDARQQRATIMLREVEYVIEAHFEFTQKRGMDDNEGKHLDIFKRRARAGQCFCQPVMGCREFPASFALLEDNEMISPSRLHGQQDLGWMLDDLEFGASIAPKFFRPIMIDGVIDVAQARRESYQ